MSFPEFTNIQRAVYYRKVVEDKVLLRVDLLNRSGEAVWSFLQNQEGEFGIHHPTKLAVRGGDFLRLFYLESLNNRPFWAPMQNLDYAADAADFQGRQCTRLTASFPKGARDDGVPLVKFHGFTGADDVEILKSYPYVRRYLIDNATGLIVGLAKYNSQGKLLSSITLGKVIFTPDWTTVPGIFDTPAKVVCQVESAGQFRQFVQEYEAAMRGKLKHHENAFVNFCITYARHFLLLAGILLVGGAWLLRRRTGE